MIIKTASDLKHMVARTGSHFFDRESMRFFGDTMANYYVPQENKKALIVEIQNSIGETFNCYALQRKRAVNSGLCSTAYFDVDTFERVLAKTEGA